MANYIWYFAGTVLQKPLSPLGRRICLETKIRPLNSKPQGEEN